MQLSRLTEHSGRIIRTAAMMLLTTSMLLAGCRPAADTPTPIPPPTKTITPSPTFSIPSAMPTSTWTPGPTLTPTADMFADVQQLLFEDSFDSDSGWSLLQDASGAASLSNDRLTVVVSRPNFFRTAISPAVTPNQFFVRMTAYAELCEEGDVYGFVFRYQSDMEHMRFLMNCSGAASVVSVQGGMSFALVPETETFAALSGRRISNTLAIAARGSEYHFFINQIEVFSVKETQLLSTGLGVIVRTGESDLATVYFDDLQLYTLVEEILDTPTPRAP